MKKDVRDWTDAEPVIDFVQSNGIYTTGVCREICRRAGMVEEYDAATKGWERIVQLAAQELCPELCRA